MEDSIIGNRRQELLAIGVPASILDRLDVPIPPPRQAIIPYASVDTTDDCGEHASIQLFRSHRVMNARVGTPEHPLVLDRSVHRRAIPRDYFREGDWEFLDRPIPATVLAVHGCRGRCTCDRYVPPKPRDKGMRKRVTAQADQHELGPVFESPPLIPPGTASTHAEAVAITEAAIRSAEASELARQRRVDRVTFFNTGALELRS